MYPRALDNAEGIYKLTRTLKLTHRIPHADSDRWFKITPIMYILQLHLWMIQNQISSSVFF